MPHKHRRNKANSDPSYWNLPPSRDAHPLAVAKNPKIAPSTHKAGPKRPPRTTKDDTPRAFARLLQPYRPPRSGHDDGVRPSKKRKLNTTTTTSANPTPSTQHFEPAQPLRIQTHEPLSHFAARVDAALPFSTLTKTRPSATDPALKGLGQARKTKTEKKMQRMQRQWREEERRRRERNVEEGEEGEGVVDESGVEDMGVEEVVDESGQQRKKGKRKREGRKDEEGDLWREVETKRKEGTGGLVGLHDVVTAPPRLGKAGVIKLEQGGLKRQVELGEARRSVVEGYREMIRRKRGG